VILAHRIALDPNDVGRTYFAKACGTARFAYNWALAEWNRQYAAGEKANQLELRRTLNAIKREKFPWMLDVTKNAAQMAIIQLGTAFKNFFDDLKKYQRGEVAKKKIRRPKFKKKGKSKDSFTVTNDQFHIDGDRIHIPNIGAIRMCEEVRFAGKALSATISRTAERWFASITVEVLHTPTVRENQGAVGVDLGVTTLATLSTGEKISGPKPHKALFGRLGRLSRSLSRKVKGSANRTKAKAKLSRLHARIANVRKDALHKLTTMLATRFDVIGIENLNVAGMVANRKLARAISDMGFFEFRRQLEYKAEMNGAKVVVIDRFFPSSKLCSDCGFHAGEMTLAVRQWTCTNCDETHDRDLNAAINLSNMAASSAVTVCGESSSGASRKARVKPPSAKQKLGFAPPMSYS
jgi:putative transposase